MAHRATISLPSGDARRAAAEAARAERHYARLRGRATRWLAGHRLDGQRAELLFLLPDLFMLVIRLLRDPRIDGALKVQLFAVSAYVIAPLDLVPDFLLPAGLADDTVALAYALTRVVAILGAAGEDVLREHWEGREDVLATVRRVVAAADRVLGSRVVTALGRRFGAAAGRGRRVARGGGG